MENIFVTLIITITCGYTIYRLFNRTANDQYKHIFYCTRLCYVIFALLLLPATTITAQETEDETEDEYKFKLYSNGEFVGSFANFGGDRFETEDRNKNTIWVPGITIGAEYNITPRWTVTLEGEYISFYGTMLDELSITHHASNAFNIKGGIFTLPFGHHNTDYGYVDYFTPGDPENDCSLFSCPNTEMGIALLGEFNCGLSYQASITSGIAADAITPLCGFYDAHQGFKQGVVNFNSPAYSLRLGYNGLKNLQMGAGIYYCNDITENSQDAAFWHDFTDGSSVLLWYADAQYENDYFTARASYMQSNQTHTAQLSYLLDEELYCCVPKQMISVMGEIGWNLKNTFYAESKGPELMPYAHFEYYDTQKEGDKTNVPYDMETYMNPRAKVNLWSFGLNYTPNENLKLKAGYTTRRIGGSEELGKKNLNEFTVSLAYDCDIFTIK